MTGGPNFDVGRYAVFIWPAYGVSALVLSGLLFESLWRAARWRKAAEAEREDAAPRETP